MASPLPPGALLWLSPLLLLLLHGLRLLLRIRASAGDGGEALLRAERARVEAHKALLHPVRDFVLVSKLGA